MASLRTRITEIVTGLGMFGYPDLPHALSVQPTSFENVSPEIYAELREAYQASNHRNLFDRAWENGERFARSNEALRGRSPWLIEWKGPHRPPGYDRIPADLRVDHVYLVSCKYGSDILLNSSPSNLFDRLLTDRKPDPADWFAETAPDEYQSLYQECRTVVDAALPEQAADLTKDDRNTLKALLPRQLKGNAQARYLDLIRAVSEETARRWTRSLHAPSAAESAVWRMLRLESAPYYVLGESASKGPIGYRIVTPGDLRRSHRFRGLEVEPLTDRGQPVVEWNAHFTGIRSGRASVVTGHIEVRWSHGKFAQPPEAKIYLDTHHHLVPAYIPLESARSGSTLF